MLTVAAVATAGYALYRYFRPTAPLAVVPVPAKVDDSPLILAQPVVSELSSKAVEHGVSHNTTNPQPLIVDKDPQPKVQEEHGVSYNTKTQPLAVDKGSQPLIVDKEPQPKVQEEETRTLVFDNGSYMSKIGYGGEREPTSIFRSVVGHPKPLLQKTFLSNAKDSYIGSDAQSKRALLSLTYPIKGGVVTNWDDLERIWHYSFYEDLSVAPEEFPVLLTDSPANSKWNREKMTQIMFETFNTPATYIANQAALSLVSAGRTTGLAFTSGDGGTHAVAVYEGSVIHHSVTSFELAGSDMTEYLSTLLSQRGYRFNTTSEIDAVREIKEKLCYVNSREGVPLSDSRVGNSYKLPDGEVITSGDEMFQCPERMFRPDSSIHDIIHTAIHKCECDIIKDLYHNIVLSGGNTMFPGFPERLRHELTEASPFKDLKVEAPWNRAVSAWEGGSTLSSLPAFQQYWISKEEYDETGPAVHRKCILY